MAKNVYWTHPSRAHEAWEEERGATFRTLAQRHKGCVEGGLWRREMGINVHITLHVHVHVCGTERIVKVRATCTYMYAIVLPRVYNIYYTLLVLLMYTYNSKLGRTCI